MSSYKYPKLPTRPCKWDQSATRRIYQALGVSAKKLPKDMHGEFKIDGWSVIVKRGKTGGGGIPRIFVRSGGRIVDVGRVRQALCRVYLHRARNKAAKQRGTGGRFKYRPRAR